MLIRNLAKRLFATGTGRSSRTYQSAPRKDSEELARLRSIDYKVMRKAAVEQYNQQLKNINKLYQRERQLRQESAKSTNSRQVDESEKRFQSFLKEYRVMTNLLQKTMNNKLAEIEETEKANTVKIYLEQSIREEKVSSTGIPLSQQQLQIPKGLILKKMYLQTEKEAVSEDPSKQLLLVGVNEEEEHCLFVAKLLEELEVKNVVTMIPPDLPFFIKTENSFLTEWKKFLEDPEFAKKTKFYVNPKPKTLEDICLHSNHFEVVRNGLGRSSSFINSHYALLKENQVTNRFEYMPLLSGLCSQTVQKIYFGDFPVFEERRMLADNMSLTLLRKLFQEHLSQFRKLNWQFSAQWLFPKEILRKKLRNVVKIARAVGGSGKGRTVLLCPAEIAQLVGIEWQLSRKQQSSTDGRGQILLDYFQGVGLEQNQTFIEHIEKLVILDLIIEPVITRYFVKYRSFPFMCHHTIGGRENIGKIFIVWMHFYSTYFQSLSENRLYDSEGKKQREEYLNQFEDPTDFT